MRRRFVWSVEIDGEAVTSHATEAEALETAEALSARLEGEEAEASAEAD